MTDTSIEQPDNESHFVAAHKYLYDLFSCEKLSKVLGKRNASNNIPGELFSPDVTLVKILNLLDRVADFEISLTFDKVPNISSDTQNLGNTWVEAFCYAQTRFTFETDCFFFNTGDPTTNNFETFKASIESKCLEPQETNRCFIQLEIKVEKLNGTIIEYWK